MRRLSLWLNLTSTNLNPSQLVLKSSQLATTVLPKQEKVQTMQKRGRDACLSHPDSQPMQEKGREHASCSRSGHLEIRPDLPGSVQDQYSYPT